MATETKLLLNTIKGLEHKLSALQQLAGLINVSSDLETTGTRVLEHVLKLLSAEAALLIVLEEGSAPDGLMVRQGKWVEPAVERAELLKRLNADLNSGLSGTTLKERQPLTVSDVKTDSRYKPELCQSFGYAASSVMVFPLVTPRGPMGVLHVFNKESEGSAFTQEDLSTASALVPLLGVILESSRVFTDIDRRVSELNNLIRANEFINMSLELETVLDTIIPLGMRVIDAEAGSILLMDPEKGQLYFAAASGSRKQDVKKVYLNRGEGVAGWVVENGKPLVIADVAKDPRFTKKVDQASGFVTKSIIALPLVVNDEIIGVVEAINKNSGGPFTERDVQLLKTIAVTGALAIQKARLFHDMNALFLDTLMIMMSALEAKDPFSLAHTERVRGMAGLLAKALEVSEKDAHALERAAVLHEIGKLRVAPDDKSARDRIPSLSAELLGGVAALKDVLPLVKHMQERWDGQGRPDGLVKEAIPLGARILAVCELYDRLSVDQPDHKGLPQEKALAELSKRSGAELDPQCVSLFKQILSGKQVVAS